MSMRLTQAQRGLFWRTFRAACRNLGVPPLEEDAYRGRVVYEEAGVHHVGDIGRAADFDRVMARLAADAGDYRSACRFGGGAAARYRHLILARARAVIQARGEDGRTPESYVAGVLVQGRLAGRPGEAPQELGARLASPGAWEDLPVETLRLVLQILTTEERRQRRQKRRGS